MHRWGGRLLFTRVFAFLAGIIAIIGVIAFGLAMSSNSDTYEIIRLNDSVTLGLAALWAVTLLSFVVHESAHALAVKHFGRTLTRGGVMLYYGLPAAFCRYERYLALATPCAYHRISRRSCGRPAGRQSGSDCRLPVA